MEEDEDDDCDEEDTEAESEVKIIDRVFDLSCFVVGFKDFQVDARIFLFQVGNDFFGIAGDLDGVSVAGLLDSDDDCVFTIEARIGSSLDGGVFHSRNVGQSNGTGFGGLVLGITDRDDHVLNLFRIREVAFHADG